MYDALIIGGGPAGATLGLLLAKAGWLVAVIEKINFPRRKVCGEFISATTLSLFNDLGIENEYLTQAGPEIKRIGLFASHSRLTTHMPPMINLKHPWGRALGREQLDTLLLNAAREAGVETWQPWTAQRIDHSNQLFHCLVTTKDQQQTLQAPIIILAHGSWEREILVDKIHSHGPLDLLGFKAHFKRTKLCTDLMPVIAFPGGYGGLVHTDKGRVSFSCCIQRTQLKKIRTCFPGVHAGEALLQQIKINNTGVREVLAGAEQEGPWLSVGPIRPGIRTPYTNGIFFVGNLAGEAHPIIAEGISMAIQSSWVLAKLLSSHKDARIARTKLDLIGKEYCLMWKKQFSGRIRASSLFAKLAMAPMAQNLMLPVFKIFPHLIGLGAQLSGKTHAIKNLFPNQ
jgi:flavin-dependent dehydrogenase